MSGPKHYLAIFKAVCPNAYWALNQDELALLSLEKYFDTLLRESIQPNAFGRVLMYAKLVGETYIDAQEKALITVYGGGLIAEGVERVSKQLLDENLMISRYGNGDIAMLSFIYSTSFIELFMKEVLDSHGKDLVFTNMTALDVFV